MKSYSQKSKPMFPNQERVPKAANQAPASVILQNYKERYLTQRKEELNQTGLPDDLKTGMENLSGYSLDDVRVHYNSDKPVQLNALAYAQGTDIHIASGQEQHLPHEAWHVVQQKQGRVHPTMQLQEINVNDNEELEKEADMMGGKAVQFKKTSSAKNDTILQRLKIKLGETEYPNAEPISDRQDRSYKVEGPFVIKIFKSGKADNEFKVMESIKGNENVVNVIKKDIAFFSDYDEASDKINDYDGNPAILMEYANYGDLASILKTNKKEEIMTSKKEIADGIIKGLNHINKQKIAHGDLDPKNIFVHKSKSGKFIAKIADFGESEIKIPSLTNEELLKNIRGASLALRDIGYLSSDLFSRYLYFGADPNGAIDKINEILESNEITKIEKQDF